MSGSAAGVHLQRERLTGLKVQHELQVFAEWLGKKERAFETINPGYSKCADKEKNTQVRPLLKALGFDDEDPKLRFNVFRIKGSGYIDTVEGGYLIPIRQESKTEIPTISNPPKPPEEEPTTQLIVGERVYFDRKVFVQSNFDCVVVTAG